MNIISNENSIRKIGVRGLKEIRLHGRGGMGAVKAGEVLVYASVKAGKYGNSIPFFGFERQGAPVTSFVRLDDNPIRPKNQVYNPNGLIVMDHTIIKAIDVFEGIMEGTALVINSPSELEELKLSQKITTIGILDATKLSMEMFGRAIPNTFMLGAFVKTTGWVELSYVKERCGEFWGNKNIEAVQKGFDMCQVCQLQRR